MDPMTENSIVKIVKTPSEYKEISLVKLEGEVQSSYIGNVEALFLTGIIIIEWVGHVGLMFTLSDIDYCCGLQWFLYQVFEITHHIELFLF